MLWHLGNETQIKQWVGSDAENGAHKADEQVLLCLIDMVSMSILFYEHASQDSQWNILRM